MEGKPREGKSAGHPRHRFKTAPPMGWTEGITRGKRSKMNRRKECGGEYDRNPLFQELTEKTQQHAPEHKFLHDRHDSGRQENPRKGTAKIPDPVKVQLAYAQEKLYAAQESHSEKSANDSDPKVAERLPVRDQTEFPEGTDPERSQQGPDQEKGGHLDGPGKVAVEGHPLDLADQAAKPIRRQGLDQMPGLGSGKRSPRKDQHHVEKDLPEGAHAGKAITLSFGEPSTMPSKFHTHTLP